MSAFGVGDLINVINTMYDKKEMVGELSVLRLNLQKKVHIIKMILNGIERGVFHRGSVELQIILTSIHDTLKKCEAFEKKARVECLSEEAKRFLEVKALLKEHEVLAQELDSQINSLSIALGLDSHNKQEESQNEIKIKIDQMKEASNIFNNSIQESIEKIVNKDTEQLKVLLNLHDTMQEMNKKIDLVHLEQERDIKRIDILQEIEQAKLIMASMSQKTVPHAVAKDLGHLLKYCYGPIELNGEEIVDDLYQDEEFMYNISKLRELRVRIEEQQLYRPFVAMHAAVAQGEANIAEINIHKMTDTKEELPKSDCNANIIKESSFVQGRNSKATANLHLYSSPYLPSSRQQSPARSRDAFLYTVNDNQSTTSKKSEGTYSGLSSPKKQ